MSAVRTFKALDYDMRLYGFWPSDLVLVCLIFVVFHSTLNSLVLDAAILGPALYVAWRARKRPPRYVKSLLCFCMTPDRHSVGVVHETNPNAARKAGTR